MMLIRATLIAIVAGVSWASFMFRYTPINESAVLDRWTGKVEIIRKPLAASHADFAAPGHLFDEFEKPAR